MLSRHETQGFYDRFGARQDSQAFYEDPAIQELLRHAGFSQAHSVFEHGSGTGRVAEILLSHHLPEDVAYVAVDLSSTMVELAHERLRRFGSRVRVEASDGAPRFDFPAHSFDRFLSTYVLDLLPEDEIRVLLQEAHRVLEPGGRLCLVSLTRGKAPVSRFVSWLWTRVHALWPRRVGGCRPLVLGEYLSQELWQVEWSRVVSAYGISSEVLVAMRKEP